jgi:hypothetical protein
MTSTLEGEAVEMDETYVGGRPRKGDKVTRGRGDKTKTCVVGVVARGGSVIAMPVTDAKSRS